MPNLTWRAASGYQPSDVWCVSRTYCVGVSTDDSGDGTAADFDGHTWSAPRTILRGHLALRVSCATVDFCAAIGWKHVAAVQQHGRWRTHGIDPTGMLKSISCPAAGFCVAVDDRGAAVVYRDGAWQSPMTIDSNPLNDVSCSSPSFCVAVDTAAQEVSYDGSTWSAPVVTGVRPISRIDCVSPDGCVGGTDDDPAVRRHGLWASVQAAEGSRGTLAISRASTVFCVYVPNSEDFNINDVMNGAALAATGLARASLNGEVSCGSDSFCLATIDGAAYVGTR